MPNLTMSVALPTQGGWAGVLDEYEFAYATTAADPPVVYKISPPSCTTAFPEYGPITLNGKVKSAPKPTVSGGKLTVQFQFSRWQASVPVHRTLTSARGKVVASSNKPWEDYDLFVKLPAGGAVTLIGTPRVFPSIPGRKDPSVVNSTTVAWMQVPMAVNPAYKEYVRKFTITVRVSSSFVGNLTFSAEAVGADHVHRSTELVVPVVASTK